ncbi:MAG TPA: hypothetical protein VGK47_04615, partial [Nitrososphaeraceae archaeon]
MSRRLRSKDNISPENVAQSINGVLVGNRIVVWDIESSRLLFGNGYFGKPMGIAKPKGTQFSHPLILDLMEGYYLSLKLKLMLHTNDGKPLSVLDIKSICRKQ